MAGIKRPHHFPVEPKPPRPTFDLFMVEECFSKVKSATESETQLLTAILKRNTDLTPTLEEQTNIAALVSQVQNVLETMSLDPQNASVFDETRLVGSYKKGTMVRGRNEADIVLVLRQSPTKESVTQISDRVQAELTNTSWASSFVVAATDYGFCVSNTSVNASVKVLITTQVGSMRKTVDGQQPSIPITLLQKHLSAVRHVRWFEDSASGGPFKVLIRVIKDIVQRFPGLQVLNRWTIDVLSHYSISFLRTETTLPLNQALKRFFQLLAGGLFLPGSAGIPDPCENGAVTLHSTMTQKQQDRLCMTAQTIVRILSHTDGFQVILGISPDEPVVLEKDFQFKGLTIRSHDPVIGTIEPENRQEVAAEVSAEAVVPSDSMETTDIPVKEEHADDTSESITLFANDPQ